MDITSRSSPPPEQLKKRSWLVLGLGAAISIIPYIGLVMWVLFLPIIIYVGLCGFKLTRTTEKTHGYVVLTCAALFVPLVLLSSSASAFLASSILNALFQEAPVLAGSDTVPESSATIEYWKKLRAFENAATNRLKEDARQYPMTESGQFDFAKFDKDDFEKLTKHHFDEGVNMRQVAADIAGLPILGVDGDLVRFKIDLCEHWNSAAKVSLGFAELVNALHQQKIQFTSGEAYALRTAKALMGQGDMETAYQESQREIDRRHQAWNLVRAKDDELREQMTKKEQEVQALLSSRYRWEFK